MTARHCDVRAKQLRNQCQDIISQVMGLDNSSYFFRPVNPEADNAPEYFQRIPKPMSIFEVQEKLDNDQYTDFKSFVSDMRRIWGNAQIYNTPSSSPVYKAAEKISRKFEMMIACIPHVIPEESKSSALQRAVEMRFARYRTQNKSHH